MLHAERNGHSYALCVQYNIPAVFISSYDYCVTVCAVYVSVTQSGIVQDTLQIFLSKKWQIFTESDNKNTAIQRV